MNPLEVFFPTYTAPSVFGLTADQLRGWGVKGIIFDIDNTLVPPNAPADEAARAFFAALREEGFQCFILSNNHEERASSFAREVGSLYLSGAGKPKKEGYQTAMARMGTGRDDTLVIGDQLITDICGANRCGIRSLLVEPIDPAHEQPFVRVKRLLEKPLLAIYRQRARKD